MSLADELRELLRKKFPADRFALLYEVRDAAGFQAGRSADALVVGLWPSRGCLIEGIEIKVSRGDWLRELKQPAKAEAFFGFCDHWWVVASHRDVVRVEELPATWGLMVPSGRGLYVVKPAPRQSPKPVDRHVLAAMLKRATGTAMHQPEIATQVAALVAEAEKRGKDAADLDGRHAVRHLADLRKTVAEFETASGISLTERWHRGATVGQAVKAVLAGEHEWRLRELERIRHQALALVKWLDDHVPLPADGKG